MHLKLKKVKKASLIFSYNIYTNIAPFVLKPSSNEKISYFLSTKLNFYQ